MDGHRSRVDKHEAGDNKPAYRGNGPAKKRFRNRSPLGESPGFESIKEELRESEAQFPGIFDSVNDAIFIHDLSTGSIIDVNRRMCEMYGYRRDEALLIDVGVLSSGVPPYTQQEALAWMEKATEGRPQLFEWRAKAKSGRLFWVEVSMTRAAIGSQDRLLVVVRDITERKLAVEASESSRQMLANVLDHFPGVVFWKDRNSVYLGCNRNFSTGAGLAAPEDIVGKADYDLPWAKTEAFAYRADDRQVMESGRPKLNIIETQLQANGRVAWFDTSKVPLFNASGQVIGVLGTSNDITERIRAERSLEKAKEQAECEKKQAEIYLDIMGHDINNMHQICLGYLELAMEASDAGRESRELIATSIKAIGGSMKLIENVKKLRRMKEGDLKYKAIDIGKLLGEILPRYSGAPGRDITVDYVEEGNSTVQANDLLEDLFSNIIGNAIKHSTGPVLVKIRQARIEEGSKNWCLVSIEDNGPGIPDRLKESLFTRFRNVGIMQDGRGLGLYLVKTLVDDFGGTVRIEDRVPGDHTLGSRFVVRLPAI